MKSWLALIGSPSLALGVQSTLYAMVTPSCAAQSRLWLHATGAGGLLLALVLAFIGWSEWSALARIAPGSPDSIDGDPQTTRRFLAAAATGVAVISCLVVLMMWAGAWVLSPCSEQ